MTEAERLEICAGCAVQDPHRVCVACGCYVPAKVRNPLESCPLGKW